MKAEVRILDSKGLGVTGRWSLVISDPKTKETWYRPFHYKKDAEDVAREPRIAKGSLENILRNELLSTFDVRRV